MWRYFGGGDEAVQDAAEQLSQMAPEAPKKAVRTALQDVVAGGGGVGELVRSVLEDVAKMGRDGVGHGIPSSTCYQALFFSKNS